MPPAQEQRKQEGRDDEQAQLEKAPPALRANGLDAAIENSQHATHTDRTSQTIVDPQFNCVAPGW